MVDFKSNIDFLFFWGGISFYFISLPSCTSLSWVAGKIFVKGGVIDCGKLCVDNFSKLPIVQGK